MAYRMSKQYPDVKQFREIMAQTAANLGQWVRALSYAEKGLQHHPQNIALMATQVRCLNETAQPQEALDIVENLLKKDRANPVYWFEKFRALVLLNRQQEARAIVQQFPQYFPPELVEELKKVVRKKG
jgi:predicted Zn-dependent protease